MLKVLNKVTYYILNRLVNLLILISLLYKGTATEKVNVSSETQASKTEDHA